MANKGILSTRLPGEKNRVAYLPPPLEPCVITPILEDAPLIIIFRDSKDAMLHQALHLIQVIGSLKSFVDQRGLLYIGSAEEINKFVYPENQSPSA